MELNEFQKLALRTESKIDRVNISRENLIHLLSMTICLTEALDGVKKAVFYNKTTKLDNEFIYRLRTVVGIANKLIDECASNGSASKALIAPQGEPNVNPRIFHGIIGNITESGELASALLKSITENEPINAVNVGEEIADGGWYDAILADELNLELPKCYAAVIEKLKIRFPDAYSDVNAELRNLDVECRVLNSIIHSLTSPASTLHLTADGHVNIKGDVVINGYITGMYDPQHNTECTSDAGSSCNSSESSAPCCGD